MADQGLSDEILRERVARLDELLGRLEATTGPSADLAMDAVEALTEIYGAALARVVALAAKGSASMRSLTADELVGHLLRLHGLHPDPAEQRIADALDEVRSELRNNADVRLAGIEGGVATIEVTATGCRSTAAAMASSIGDVVLAAAPELAGVEPVMVQPPREPAIIPADSLMRRPVST